MPAVATAEENVTGNPSVPAAQEAIQAQQKSDEAMQAFVLTRNTSLSETAAMNIVKSMDMASETYGVDRELIAAVIWIESNFEPDNVTGRCIGLMQIHVNTGKALGLSVGDLYNSDLSIKYGTKYLSGHIASYNGDVMKALSAYNQGTPRVNSGNYSTWYQEKVAERWNKVENYIAGYLETH